MFAANVRAVPNGFAVDLPISGERSERPTDRVVAEVAGRQHGVVGRTQLRELGLSRNAIDNRVAAGRLHPLHRGVYAVGHRAVSREGRWMAAVLAGGPGAVLSHRSAAALWGIRATSRASIEITVPASRRPRDRIEFHRATLPADEVTRRSGIPITTLPRTALDLAAVIDRRGVERAMHEAEVLRLTDPLSLVALVERYPGRRGVATIKAIVAEASVGAAVTRSELEDRFLAFLEGAQLPRPVANALVVAGQRIEVDFAWRSRRVAVELDGHATHATRAAFERDRARDRMLQAAGWRVVRVTWRQLHEEPRSIERDLRRLLAGERH